MISIAQTCEVCPAGYYCIGGSASRAACPAATFSRPASNSSSACQRAVFIVISTTLGLAQSSFTFEVQHRFEHALALLCGVADYQIMIQSLSESRWSMNGSEGPGIEVVSKVAVSDLSIAKAVLSRIDQEALSAAISQVQLSQGKLNYMTIDVSSESVASANWIIAISCTVGALMVLSTLAVSLWCLNRKSETATERQLRIKVTEIRRALKITWKDGYAVGSEGQTLFRRRVYIYLSRAQIEAAANLEMMQDFDVSQFDALCLCLADGSPDSQRSDLLALWLLRCCKFLLKPDIPDQYCSVTHRKLSMKQLIHRASFSAPERFRYFEDKVIKARIWTDNKDLFSRLKLIAKNYMDKLSALCHLRYEELQQERKGEELVQFHLPGLEFSRTRTCESHELTVSAAYHSTSFPDPSRIGCGIPTRQDDEQVVPKYFSVAVRYYSSLCNQGSLVC